ncbi:MAG: hypothetical protein LZF85_10760, partial [Nitrosomonas sp.]|uniref:hypothetical protein n=1 Tax=Nitrosomonas sp. TaxID=42353 RepID=UPI0025FEAC46
LQADFLVALRHDRIIQTGGKNAVIEQMRHQCGGLAVSRTKTGTMGCSPDKVSKPSCCNPDLSLAPKLRNRSSRRKPSGLSNTSSTTK